MGITVGQQQYQSSSEYLVLLLERIRFKNNNRGNTDNCVSYPTFLDSIKLELVNEINDCVRRINTIKYNLKLERVYVHRELSAEDRAFKTVSREVYIHSDVSTTIYEDFTALMSEEDRYVKKGSGFTLSILLMVYC